MAKQNLFTWSVARFPIILAEDDPSLRLKDEIQKIKNDQGVFYENIDAFFSLIHADDACRALYWLALHQYPGAYNFAAKTPIRSSHFIKLIEEKLQKKAKHIFHGNPSPFSLRESWIMNTFKSRKLGFECQEISEWLPSLIS